VDWQVCSSAAIAKYRHSDGIVELVYVEGDMIYDYPCSEMLFAEFLVAPSKGRFVNRVLKPQAESSGWTPTPRPFGA
jgi:hypothetical protein